MTEHLSAAEYAALVRGGAAIKSSPRGVKVWRLPNDRIVKLFRNRRRLGRWFLQPPSGRFVLNSDRLADLGFATVRVDRCFRLGSKGPHGVVYRALPGQSLELSLSSERDARHLSELGRLIARLHEAGVMFRALHLGNVIVGPDGTLGLIDIGDLTVFPAALDLRARRRNFRHLLRRVEDRRLLAGDPLQQVMSAYSHASRLPEAQAAGLRRYVARLA